MKDNSLELWLKHNSIKENNIYVEKLLKKFKIDKYNFINNGYGEEDLLLSYNNIEYKLSIDEFDKCLKIFKKNLSGNKKKKEYYHLSKEIYGVGLMYEALKLIVKSK